MKRQQTESTPKKLSLKRESLKNLTTEELKQLVGGRKPPPHECNAGTGSRYENV